MEQKQTLVEQKSTKTVFKPRADLEFLYNVLEEALQTRAILPGLEEEHVKNCLKAYLVSVFSDPKMYKAIDKVLIRSSIPISVKTFINSSLLPEFIKYLMQYSNGDVEAFWQREINHAASQRVCYLLVEQFTKYKNQGLMLLTEHLVNNIESTQFKLIQNNLSQQWNSKISAAKGKSSYFEKIPELPPLHKWPFWLMVLFVVVPLGNKYALRPARGLDDNSQADDSLYNASSISLVLVALLAAAIVGKKLHTARFGAEDAKPGDLLNTAGRSYLEQHPIVPLPEYKLITPILAAGKSPSPVIDSDEPDKPPKSRTPKRWQLPPIVDDKLIGSSPREKKHSTLPANIEDKKKNVTFIPIAFGDTTMRHFKADREKLKQLYKDKYPRENPDQFIAGVIDKVTRERAVDKVGDGEKHEYKTNHKLRLDNIARNRLRIAVQSREATKDEEELGVAGEVESPKAIVSH